MQDTADSVFRYMMDFFNNSGDLVALLGIAAIVFTIILLSKKGLAGRGFWGKQRKKVAEYDFQNGRWHSKLLIYKLRNRRGYEGYGIEFLKTKHRSNLGSAGMSMRVFAIEFTKYEADKMVELIAPHLGNTSR